jgi:hypothetical protein
VTPRVPPVAASVTMEKSAMQIADAVAVIDIAPAGHTTTSVGATECECTGGKRGSGESKGDCKSNYGLTQHDLPFHRIVLNTYDRALRNRFIDIAAIWACLRQFFCGRGAPWSRPSFHARKAMSVLRRPGPSLTAAFFAVAAKLSAALPRSGRVLGVVLSSPCSAQETHEFCCARSSLVVSVQRPGLSIAGWIEQTIGDQRKQRRRHHEPKDIAGHQGNLKDLPVIVGAATYEFYGDSAAFL